MELEVVWAGLVGHTASLALVELVAKIRVFLLDKVIGATDSSVRECVLALTVARQHNLSQSIAGVAGVTSHSPGGRCPAQTETERQPEY